MIEAKEPFAIFADTVLPGDLPDALYMHMGAIAEIAKLDAGEQLMPQAADDTLVFMSSGSAKLAARVSDGREQVIAFHFAGDFLLLPAPADHEYRLTMLESSDLLVFSSAQFLQLANGEPCILKHLLDHSSAMLSRSREKSIVLGRKNACERMASFLLSMANRIGVSGTDGISLNLPMSRRDIGDSLGLTIETVSRQLTALREARIIETCGRSQVILRHPEELRKRSGWITQTN